MFIKPKVTLLHATPIIIGEIAGRTCYDSFSLSENEEVVDFPASKQFDKDIDSSALLHKLSHVFHHESVLEHINLTFHIEDINRAVLIEATRHRIGIAFSVRSTRYTMGKILKVALWAYHKNNPALFTDYVKSVGLFTVVDESIKGGLAISLWDKIITIYMKQDFKDNCMLITPKEAPESYNTNNIDIILKLKVKKNVGDNWKWIVDETWAVSLVFSLNLRALKHFLSLRNAGSAWFAIRNMAQAMQDEVDVKYLELILKSKEIEEIKQGRK